jgi:hypothetical protein
VGVVEPVDVQVVRIAVGHRDDLGVRALLVLHPEHADRPGHHVAAGEGRLRQQYQRVQRVAVLGQGAVEEAVVGRVDRGREQPPVQPHHVPFAVELVLVAAALGDLDDDLDHVVGHAGCLLGDSDAGPWPIMPRTRRRSHRRARGSYPRAVW